MAEKIKLLIEDPDRRNHMGIQARKVAEKRFDLHRMVDDYLNFYTEVIDRESSSQKAIKRKVQ
jgi:glycosyltransferase involved in cell wall biosynthesis